MKKICIVTGSRAEYGLLNPLMKGIQDSSKLKLQSSVNIFILDFIYLLLAEEDKV